MDSTARFGSPYEPHRDGASRNTPASQQRDAQPAQEGRSLIALFSDLWRETSTLVHEEAELAKAELSEKVSQVGTGAVELAVGALVAFAGFIVVLFAASN